MRRRGLALRQQVPVVAAVEDQRVALARLGLEHVAGEDHVVSALDQVAQLAGDPDQGVLEAGEPSLSDRSTPPHFSASGPLPAKRRARSCWPAARALTPKRPASRTDASVREPRSRQASIIGGSSESEVTAFAVAPERRPSEPNAVTTVTPVG